jgi:hypothetical protein
MFRSRRPVRQGRTAARTSQALQFLITLMKTDPLIWRRIQVPEEYSFWDLHVAIQDAMGWQDCHLHEYRIYHPNREAIDRLGIPDKDFPDERPCRAGWEVPVSEYFSWETLSDAPPAKYVYDFGDEWHHVVTFEDILPGRSRRYPRCVAGARACPLEDCGGIHGFEEFLAAIANPKHPEHGNLLDWAGGAYDPEAFDPSRVTFDDPRKRWKNAFQK